MIILTADNQHIQQICDIHTQCWKEVYHFMPPKVHEARCWHYRQNQWSSVLSDTNLSRGLFVMRQTYSDEVIGFGFCQENVDCGIHSEFEITAIYLRPEYRRQRNGSRLLKHMINHICHRGCRKVSVWAFDKNPNLFWYNSIGFEPKVKRDRIISNVAIAETGFLSENAYNVQAALSNIIGKRHVLAQT